MHSIAFGPQSVLGGEFLNAGWDDVATALQVSTYSYKSLATACLPLMSAGGSIVGLTFDATKAWPVYDWMGVAKAGLESASRYLALHLGKQGIRSNLVSAGPLRTMAAKSIPGFEQVRGGLGRAGAAGLGPHRPGTGRPGGAAPCCPTGSRPPPGRSCTSTAGTTPWARRAGCTPPGRPGEDGPVAYDAFVLLSFGGPEQPDDVMPFLRNVTRGRGVPDERLAEVAEHYHHFGGVSPINQQNRDLLAAVEPFAATACPSTGATGTGSRCSPTPWRRCATTA